MKLGNFVIFGDSYSTFRGWIPEGYATYYYAEGGATDVRRVEETWWHQVIGETGANLLLNDSWSGSTVCYTGYEKVDCSETSSFIFRLNRLIDQGFFEKNKVDSVVIFGGTNDNWAESPMGELQYSGWQKQDLYAFLPAICCFMDKLKSVLPDANMVWIINTELRDDVVDGLKEACAHYGVPTIELRDLDKVSGHPTILGMQQIRDQVLEALK